jgi:PAS domain S-box-containing protein
MEVAEAADGAAYELFFRRSPKAMYVFDVQTLAFVDVNDAALDLYGFNRAEFLRLTALDIRPATEVPAFLTCLRTNDPSHRVWRHRRRDGSELAVEVDWMRHDVTGRRCELAVVTDVTTREQALAQVGESEQRFRDAVDVLLDGFNVFSPIRDDGGRIVDFRFDYVNDAASRIFGRPKDELVGARVLELFPSYRGGDMIERYRRVIESRQPIELEAHPHDDVVREGKQRLFNVRAAPIGDRLGVAFRDVTERHLAERALRNSEERFRTVFDAGPIGIVIVDATLTIVDANPAVCRFLGYDRAQLRGMTLLDITHPQDADLDAELARRVFDGDLPSYRLEKRYVTAFGETVWGSLTASAVFDESGAAVAGIRMIQDITADKNREAEAARNAAEAHRRLAELTSREREILDLVASNSMKTRDLAGTLHISARTAESHLASVYRKLRVGSRDAAVTEYRELVGVIARAGSPATSPVSGRAR